MPRSTIRQRNRVRTIRRALSAVVALVVVVAFVVVVVGTLRPSPARPARPIVIASGSWPPFVGPDLPEDGPVARIVTETLRSQGYDPTVSYSSWPTALDRTDRGEVYGSFPFVGSAQRDEDYHLSDPLLEFDYVLFYSTRHHPSPPAVETARNLRELRVGLIDGYDVWPELDEAVGEFVPYESSYDAFRALDEGEIDLLPEGLLSGEAVVTGPDMRAGSGDFGVLEGRDNPLLAATATLHFTMPRTPEARQEIERFDDALADIKRTDVYAAAMAEMRPGTAGQTVELVPPGAAGVVEVTDEAGRTLLVPQGSEARVLEWPDAFTTGRAAGSGGSTRTGPVRVKLLNGPAAGSVVEVDPAAIHLSAPSD